MICVGRKNQIITLPAFGEILLSVVNDMVCANRSRRVHLGYAAHGRNLSPEGFSDLNCKCADATRRAIYQHLLARLNLSLITKRLQSSERRHWDRCSLLKRHIGRFKHQFTFASTCVLSKCSAAHSEHLIAGFEAGYVLANVFDLAGHITAYSCVSGFAQPSKYAQDVWCSENAVNWIDRSWVNFYQYFVVLRNRSCCLSTLQHIRWSVLCANNRFHKALPGGR